MPMGNRRKRARQIANGDDYTIDEVVELKLPEMRTEPPIELQGEPWGWTKEGDKPKGFREDGIYDNRTEDDPIESDGRDYQRGA